MILLKYKLCTQLSLLIRAGEFWWVYDEVGKDDGLLRAKVLREEDQVRPPVHGWQFCVCDIDSGKRQWHSDLTLKCSREVSTPCTEVRVKLQGETKKKYPDLEGSYLPVKGKMNRGRWVGFLINQH